MKKQCVVKLPPKGEHTLILVVKVPVVGVVTDLISSLVIKHETARPVSDITVK